MTLKVDQGHWRWHNSTGTHDFLLVVCSNNASTLYRFWDSQRRIMACPRLGSHQPCEFMHLLSRFIFLSLVVWVYIHSVLQSEH